MLARVTHRITGSKMSQLAYVNKAIPIDAHGLKIQGVRDVFAKIPRGGQGFQEKVLGGSPYFGFYCIFINKFFKTNLALPYLT
jgi:hypothetical protein